MAQQRPSARSLDREMLIYAAGRAAQGSKRPWQVMCGLLTALLCGSLLLHVTPTKPMAPVTVVEQSSSPVPLTERPPSDHTLAYLTLQKTVLKNGLDALPAYRAKRTLSHRHLDEEALMQTLLSSDKPYPGLM